MLDTQPRLQACDDFYAALIAAHQGLTTEESHSLHARLVLLLANQIGDQAVLEHALLLARQSAAPHAGAPQVTPLPAITPVVPTHAA